MGARTLHLTLIFAGLAILVGCAEERRPRSVTEFIDNPIMLEAAMVRCAQDRSKTRYDPECVNVRQAVQQIEAKEEAARRAEFEARSESKRRALRRTQQAASEARRRASEADRLAREAEYLAQFGVEQPPDGVTDINDLDTGNTPLAVIPAADQTDVVSTAYGETVPATDGGNAAISSGEESEPAAASDLGTIRDELQRRNEESND